MRPLALGRELVCHVLLVETPRDGLVLVDAGFGTIDLEQPHRRLGRLFTAISRPVRDPTAAAVHQVRALGYDPRDVRHIVLTHMDIDHAGGLSDFPDAAVHVHALEHAAAVTHRDRASKARYVPSMWAHDVDFHRYDDLGEPWHGFDAVRQLDGLPPEILLVPLHGHSRGHTAVVVETGDGAQLHAGDAYFDHTEVHGERSRCPRLLRAFQRVTNVDMKLRKLNQRRLRTLAREATEVTIFSAHDPRELPGH